MKLWTNQTLAAYQRLQKREILIGDWRRVPHYFKHPYKWMVKQMEDRHITLDNRPPIWAWCRKPDLRQTGHFTSGVKGVRLELEVPSSLVLLSNFEDWHWVLNGGTNENDFGSYFPTEEEFDEWCANLNNTNFYSREQTMQSWQRIFRAKPDDACQACLPYLLLEWVRDEKEFVAR